MSSEAWHICTSTRKKKVEKWKNSFLNSQCTSWPQTTLPPLIQFYIYLDLCCVPNFTLPLAYSHAVYCHVSMFTCVVHEFQDQCSVVTNQVLLWRTYQKWQLEHLTTDINAPCFIYNAIPVTLVFIFWYFPPSYHVAKLVIFEGEKRGSWGIWVGACSILYFDILTSVTAPHYNWPA